MRKTTAKTKKPAGERLAPLSPAAPNGADMVRSPTIEPTAEAAPLRHAADLPEDWLGSYFKSVGEGEQQLSLAGEIALVDSQIAELTKQLKKPKGGEALGSTGAWKEAVFAYRLLRRGAMERDKNSQQEAMRRLEAVFETHGKTAEVRKELYALVALRRRLVDSEAAAQHRLGKFTSKAEVERVFQSVKEAILAEVKDPDTISRIAERLQAVSA